jgi:hypothetical protein
VAPYFPSELPENELAILDWLIENHYNDDNDLSIYIDHIAKLPAEEMKLEICGEVFYSKQLKPIFEKHFGG